MAEQPAAVGGLRSGARGEYGGLLPIRPAAGVPVLCLRNEDLELYGMTQTYSHLYRLHGTHDSRQVRELATAGGHGGPAGDREVARIRR